MLHSGDWKIDRTPVLGQGMDEKRLREIGAKGVDVLVCDFTNVLREGFSPSEADVAETHHAHRQPGHGPRRHDHLRLPCRPHRHGDPRGARQRAARW